MLDARRWATLWQDYRPRRINRRTLLQGLMAMGGLAVSPRTARPASLAQAGRPTADAGAPGSGTIVIRWLGGGGVELATPDYKQIAYLDAWVWNNAGWSRFGIEKPPEYASKDGFVQYVKSKSPEAVAVLLTHDHADHIGDYFEVLQAYTRPACPSRACLPKGLTARPDQVAGPEQLDHVKDGGRSDEQQR